MLKGGSAHDGVLQVPEQKRKWVAAVFVGPAITYLGAQKTDSLAAHVPFSCLHLQDKLQFEWIELLLAQSLVWLCL